MATFKLLLSLALVAVAFAADEPQIAFAEVELSGPSTVQLGKPFVLTCKFNATFPKSDDESSLASRWTAEVSFSRDLAKGGMQVLGSYTKKDGYSAKNKYITENYFEAFNAYPTTDVSKDTSDEMRTEYSVVVLDTRESVQWTATTSLQCAVKLHKGYSDSQYDQAGVRYTSNTFKYNI